jgi:hypothetical protein
MKKKSKKSGMLQLGDAVVAEQRDEYGDITETISGTFLGWQDNSFRIQTKDGAIVEHYSSNTSLYSSWKLMTPAEYETLMARCQERKQGRWS